MEMRSVNIIEYFIFASLIIFESCVFAGKIPLPVESPGIVDAEDFVPESLEKDVIPPFGEPKLGVDDFDEYEGHGAGFIPPEYDYKNTINKDFGKDFNRGDEIPERHPDDRFDRDPDKKVDDEDKKDDDDGDDNYKPEDVNKPDIYGSNDVDNHKPDSDDDDSHKPDDDHGSGESFDGEEDFDKDKSHVPDEHSHGKDFDEPQDHGSDEFDVEDRTEKPLDVDGEPDDEHIDEGIDKDDDESPEDSDDDNDDDDFKHVEMFPPEEKDAEEVPDLDEDTVGSYPYGGFIFETPFFNMRQVSKYFQQLEKALEQVFRQSMDEATLLNGTYANTTEEEIEIDGKKYLVQKSIIKGKHNNSSIYIEALSKFPSSKKNETQEE